MLIILKFKFGWFEEGIHLKAGISPEGFGIAMLFNFNFNHCCKIHKKSSRRNPKISPRNKKTIINNNHFIFKRSY